MIYPKMIGVVEAMTDDRFVCWIEKQKDALLNSLSVFELYNLYQESKQVKEICKEVDISTTK